MISDDEIRRILDAHPGWKVSDVEFELSLIDFWRKQRLAEPCPVRMAHSLPPHLLDDLRGAYRTDEGYRVKTASALLALRPLGLAAYNGPFLTTYGAAVRGVVIQKDKTV